MTQSPKFRLQFLGTGTSAGSPILHCECPTCLPLLKDKSKHKLRMSAIIYLEDGHNILIDCGTDIRRELLREHVDHIDSIIFTHGHADHLHGFHDIRRYSIAQKKPIPIYCDQLVYQNIQDRYENDISDEDKSSTNDSNEQHQKEKKRKYFDIHVLDVHQSQTFELFGLKFTTIPIMHGKLPIIGYKFANFIYITDAKFISDESFQIINSTKVEVLIINTLEENHHPTHFCFEESLETISKIKPKIAYLIHPSHIQSHQQIQDYFDKNKNKYASTKNIPIILTVDRLQCDYKKHIQQYTKTKKYSF